MKRLWIGLMAGLSLLVLPKLASADSIAPSSFGATLAVGESTTVHKVVTVNAGTAETQADIFFLSDTTGSMGTTINSVRTAATAIMTGTAAALGNVAWGVGEYKDQPATSGDPFAYRLDQAITTVQASVTTGLNQWVASGGNDFPEANLFGLTQAAGASTGWRAGSQKIIVWFGDAPGHDPDGGATLPSTILALQAAGAKVIAFDVGSLNSTGQATAIAAATGGSYNSGLGSNPAQVIINAITAAFQTYTSVCLDTTGSPAGVMTTSTPCVTGSFDRSVDRTFDFDVTFKGVTPGDYSFSVNALVDGGKVASEADRIIVTGGAVPEPLSLSLVGLGLVGLGLIRRRAA